MKTNKTEYVILDKKQKKLIETDNKKSLIFETYEKAKKYLFEAQLNFALNASIVKIEKNLTLMY